MILLWFIIILMAGGILAWLSAQWSIVLCRWISVLSLMLNFVLALVVWFNPESDASSTWISTFNAEWIPSFGIGFSLAIDGLSLLMLILTFLLGVLGVVTSWREIQYRVGFFHFNLLWVLAGITGVFLTMDLFLFYFFWEVMLIPMYFLIGIWGHENRRYAAFKFFIFTQASGLLMLLAILGLYFIHGAATDNYTFNDGGTQQCFISKDSSWRKRLEHVRNTGIGGIGIWALGYDGARIELWDGIRQAFAVPTGVTTAPTRTASASTARAGSSVSRRWPRCSRTRTWQRSAGSR